MYPLVFRRLSLGTLVLGGVLSLFSCNNYNLLAQLENPGSSANSGLLGQATSCGANCRIFVSTNMFSGNMGGVYGADMQCRFDPANPDGTGRGNWKAMLVSADPLRQACVSLSCQVSGAAENVDWVLRPNTSYRRPDGTPIGTTSANGIFEAELTASIGASSAADVWTGLDSNWRINSSLHCGNWNDGTSGAEASIGTSTGVTGIAIDSSTSFCNQGNYLYCVEQ